jgi:nicotinamidase-related amidase
MDAYQEFLQRNDCLLMLVDIQKVLLDPCVDGAGLRRNAAALLDIAGILGIPAVLTTHNAQKLGGFLPELLARLPEPLVLDKLEFSCFSNDAMARAIQRTGRRTLLLAGLEAHVCVFHTGAHALRLGHRVHVATDAVSARSLHNRIIGLGRLEKAGAVMSSTEMIIYELLERAGTPAFRAALPLLKSL